MRKTALALGLLAGFIPAIAAAQAPPAIPSLPDAERRTSYSISASTCACSVGFALYGDSTDYGSWLEVFVNGVRKTAVTDWVLTSATGSLGSIARPITDGVVTFTVAQTGTVQIVGARRPRRTTQFSENRGVAARDLNQAITDLTAQNREVWDKVNDVTGRVLLGLPGETVNLLPAQASRALSALGFDAAGQPIALSYSLGLGTVVGPNSSVDGHVAVFSGTTGTIVKDGGAGVGTVLSVGLSLPNIITVTGSPVTSSGTLTGTLATQLANVVWAGPATGSAAAPTFRALVGADLPNPSASTLGGIQSKAAVGSQWINAISTSGVPSQTQPAFTDISGTASAAQLPNPSASTLGGVQSYAAVSNQWINTISTSGVPSSTQPAFSNLSGSVAAGQMPALTGDVTTSAGAVATTIATNAVTNAKAAQMGAASIKCNPTNATANGQDCTIQGLTARGPPDATNDKVPIYDNAAGTLKYVTPNQIASSATAGVSSLNGLSGSLSIAAGTGMSVTAAGSAVTINNTGPWTNTRLAKTAAYAALTADCGSTVALGGTAFYTLTINAASGYAATCAFVVVNEDTGRGKTMAINGLTSFILWPGQTIIVYNDNNVWKTDGPKRWKLAAAVTINVDQGAGADTNDGLATGAGNAIQTDAQAWLLEQGAIDAGSNIITILHANGPYTTAVNLAGPNFNSNVVFDGGNQVFNVTGNAIQVTNGAVVTIQNIQLTATVICLAVFNPGSTAFLAGTFQTNACTTVALFSDRHGYIEIGTTYLINGNGTTVMQCSHQGNIRAIGQHMSLVQNVTYTQFIEGHALGDCTFQSIAWDLNAHTFTGAQWTLTTNSVFYTAGASASTFGTAGSNVSNTGAQVN